MSMLLERTAATMVERSMILKRADKGLNAFKIADRTGIPLHIVENTLRDRNKFERRKQLSAHERDLLIRKEHEFWQLSEACPFVFTDTRSEPVMELIGNALMGRVKPETAIKKADRLMQSFSNSMTLI